LTTVNTNSSSAWIYTNGSPNPKTPQINPDGYYSNFYGSGKTIQVNIVA
jgi:hypothetical protein